MAGQVPRLPWRLAWEDPPADATDAELRFGAEARRSRRLHRLISTFVETVEVLSFDQPAAARFGTVAASLARLGEPIGTPEQPRFAGRSSAAERTRQDQTSAGSTVRSLNGGSATGSLVTRPASAYAAPASA